MCIATTPDTTMKSIQKDFKFKDDKIGKPTNYLGAQLEHKTIDGQLCWVISSEKYFKASIIYVEQKLEASGQRLPPRCYTPFSSGYQAEIDESGELKADGV